MAKQIEISVNKREELGKKARKVRQAGLIPAVVYGRKIKSVPLSIDAKEYKKNVLESDAGSNLIFTLKLKEGDKVKALPVITYDIERDPLTDQIIHVDFMHVSMDEAIKAKVPVELIGIPFGVKEEGGVLVHGLREIEIKCLPGDIPDKYEVDVAALKINESLRVSDLKISKKVEILAAPGEMVATVSPPTKEEEVAPPVLTPEEEAAAAAAAVGAEGAEAAVAAAPGAAPAEGKPAAKKEEKAAPQEKKK